MANPFLLVKDGGFGPSSPHHRMHDEGDPERPAGEAQDLAGGRLEPGAQPPKKAITRCMYGHRNFQVETPARNTSPQGTIRNAL